MKTFIFILVMSVFSFGESGAQTSNFKLFEISVLYPLPSVGQWDDLLSPRAASNILPFEIFNEAKFLTNQPNEKIYPVMRVVGVRVDPCFVEGPAPVKCEPQIRFVWQPLTTKNGKASTIDAAVHVFFSLTSEELTELLEKLEGLQVDFESDYLQARESPLGIHPILAKRGLTSSFAQRLNAIWISTIAGKTIHRMTFMKLKGMDDIWIFGGFDFIEMTSKPIVIPGLDSRPIVQEFINSLAMRPKPTQFLGGAFPSSETSEIINAILSDSGNSGDLTEEQIHKMIQSTADFENPRKNNPGTLDCVNCHVANMIRTWSETNFPNFNLPWVYEQFRFQVEEYDITNVGFKLRGQTNILRMFGYFEDEPIVSQRTINETADSARLLRHKK